MEAGQRGPIIISAVELFKQLLWQVELPWLAEEIHIFNIRYTYCLNKGNSTQITYSFNAILVYYIIEYIWNIICFVNELTIVMLYHNLNIFYCMLLFYLTWRN